MAPRKYELNLEIFKNNFIINTGYYTGLAVIDTTANSLICYVNAKYALTKNEIDLILTLFD